METDHILLLRCTRSIGLCVVLLLPACGDKGDSTRTDPVAGGTTGGSWAASGGVAAGGTGGALGGAISDPGETGGGDVQTGGTWFNFPTGGAGGSGGEPRMSQDPPVAAVIAAHDAGCRAACEVAMGCISVFETMDDCLSELLCLNIADTTDLIPSSRETIIGCLSVAAEHMECVGGLECAGFLGWWSENVSPFPCQTEQYAEEAACDGVGYFY